MNNTSWMSFHGKSTARVEHEKSIRSSNIDDCMANIGCIRLFVLVEPVDPFISQQGLPTSMMDP